MAKSIVAANALLSLEFQAIRWPGIAVNDTVTPVAAFYLALHTADPTAGGNQSTNEIAYTGYGRIAVMRTASGWAVANEAANTVSIAAFSAGIAGPSPTATFFSVGLQQTGPGEILYSGPIVNPILCGNGIQPVLATVIITEN